MYTMSVIPNTSNLGSRYDTVLGVQETSAPFLRASHTRTYNGLQLGVFLIFVVFIKKTKNVH